MSFFKSNETIHKNEDGSYYVELNLCVFLTDPQFVVLFSSGISIVKLHEPSYCFNIIIGAY